MTEHEHEWEEYELYTACGFPWLHQTEAVTTGLALHPYYVGYACACGEQGYAVPA